jgi:outer membrane lipoprotein SlyB
MTKKPVLVFSIVAAVLLAGCAAKRPTLYPNEKLQTVGTAQSQQDIADCETKAQEWVKSGGQNEQLLKEGAKNIAVGTAVGAASGAVGGAIWGNAGSGAAGGAAAGATAGVLGTLFGWMMSKSEPEPVYRAFVERCLADKGYQTIGWQ